MELAARYRKVADRFTATVAGVDQDGWELPTQCDGWVARDVVRHLVEWVPALLDAGASVSIPEGPPVEDDPLGAWRVLDDALQAILDDPALASRRFAHPQAGEHALGDAIGMFVLGDVLLHTWDLAHATGQDETLDPDEVGPMLAGMLPLDEMLRGSGQYGPKVEVPDDADDQTKLLAFIGRDPRR